MVVVTVVIGVVVATTVVICVIGVVCVVITLVVIGASVVVIGVMVAGGADVVTIGSVDVCVVPVVIDRSPPEQAKKMADAKIGMQIAAVRRI